MRSKSGGGGAGGETKRMTISTQGKAPHTDVSCSRVSFIPEIDGMTAPAINIAICAASSFHKDAFWPATDGQIAGFSGEHRFLSNFWPVELSLDGDIYPSVENAFQAAKSLTPDERLPFRTFSPGNARKAGRRLVLRNDWNEVRLGVMAELLVQKFPTGSRLADRLLATSPLVLVEANGWEDRLYGASPVKGGSQRRKSVGPDADAPPRLPRQRPTGYLNTRSVRYLPTPMAVPPSRRRSGRRAGCHRS
jgi:ribA/ribD-fused uncharacterized protein